jgi:NADH:ubiquinone oxidoreductase subunit 5 (subunit L)/multisubunit Na+/H+ antiporter MnhA subunit
LAILGFLSVVVGFLGSPWINAPFFRYLVGGTEQMNWFVAGTALASAGAGMIVAFVDFAKPSLVRDGFISFVPPLRTLFVRLYYVDDFYYFCVHKIVLVVSKVLDWFDKRMVNGAVNATGLSTIFGGRVMSRLQSGTVQLYIGVMFAVVVCIVSCFMWR